MRIETIDMGIPERDAHVVYAYVINYLFAAAYFERTSTDMAVFLPASTL
jgi:hypothetical protein